MVIVLLQLCLMVSVVVLPVFWLILRLLSRFVLADSCSHISFKAVLRWSYVYK